MTSIPDLGRGVNFGVVDGKGNVISEEMLNLLRGVE